MLKTVCTRQLCLVYLPEWLKSERYMTTFKMFHIVSSRDVLKICKHL